MLKNNHLLGGKLRGREIAIVAEHRVYKLALLRTIHDAMAGGRMKEGGVGILPTRLGLAEEGVDGLHVTEAPHGGYGVASARSIRLHAEDKESAHEGIERGKGETRRRWCGGGVCVCVCVCVCTERVSRRRVLE